MSDDTPSTEVPYRLDFLDLSFRRGLQNTLRRGDKHLHLTPGQRLALHRTGEDEPSPQQGKVVYTLSYETLDDVPEYFVQLNHAAPTREQLVDAMFEAYGPEWESEGLTLILFQV